MLGIVKEFRLSRRRIPLQDKRYAAHPPYRCPTFSKVAKKFPQKKRSSRADCQNRHPSARMPGIFSDGGQEPLLHLSWRRGSDEGRAQNPRLRKDFATLPGLGHLYNRPCMEPHELGRLVEKARKGDRDAFQAIYEHFVKRIYNFLFRMVGSAHEAEDLTQQTFLHALQQLGTLRNIKQIESWMYRIARNEAYQKFRRKGEDLLDDGDVDLRIERLREVRIHAQPDKSLMNLELREVIQ